MDLGDLPIAEFAHPGPLRDQLVAAILRGDKTATTSLLAEYEEEGVPLPRPGDRFAVVDSDGNRVAAIETVSCEVMRAGDVGDDVAFGEGEDYTDRDDWWRGHHAYWSGYRPEETTDDTPVVVEWFRRVA